MKLHLITNLYYFLKVVEFKDYLRPHLRRGELVVGNNYVRVVKSPESYDSTERWCDGSVSVRLIVTTFPRFFFVDLPSDLDPKPQENICCTPSFAFPEVSSESFFSIFLSDGSANKSSTSAEILEARRRAARQMSKEQKSWNSSSHPRVIEMSGDSLEVCFFSEHMDIIEDESKHSDDTVSEVDNSAETYARFNTYIFIDEINGSKYWFNVFADLRRIRLLSSERVLQSTVIGKESKKAAARSNSMVRRADDFRAEDDEESEYNDSLKKLGIAESQRPGSLKELVYPEFTKSPDFIDGDSEEVSHALPSLRLKEAKSAPKIGALKRDSSTKEEEGVGSIIASQPLQLDVATDQEKYTQQQDEEGVESQKANAVTVHKSRGSEAATETAAATSIDSLKAYLEQALRERGSESGTVSATSIDAVDTGVDAEKVHTDRGSETGTVSAAVVVASVDAVKVKKDTDVDVEKVHIDRGSETGTVSAAAAVAVASVDAVKVKKDTDVDVEKVHTDRGSETGTVSARAMHD